MKEPDCYLHNPGDKRSIACRHLFFAGGDRTKAYVFLNDGEWQYICEQCVRSDILPDEQSLSNWVAVCDDCIEEALPMMTIIGPDFSS